MRYFTLAFVCVALMGSLQGAADFAVPSGAKLYVAPMEWNLDRFVQAEIQKQGLPIHMVSKPEESDFIMTGVYQTLGSRMIAPGHYIQVQIASADGNRQVWSTDASDYALFFGRLRPHGPHKAAAELVRKLNRHMKGQ